MFGKGPLKMKISLPNGLICFSGHRLPVEIEIDNKSTKKIDFIKTILYSSILMNAHGRALQRKSTLFQGTVNNSAVEPLGKLAKNLLIDIPAFVEPSITLGTLIHRHYELAIELRGSWASTVSETFNIDVYYPISLNREYLGGFLGNEVNSPPKEEIGKSQSPPQVEEVKAEKPSQEPPKEETKPKGEPFSEVKL